MSELNPDFESNSVADVKGHYHILYDFVQSVEPRDQLKLDNLHLYLRIKSFLQINMLQILSVVDRSKVIVILILLPL